MIKSGGLRSSANSFTRLRPQISAFDHVPSLRTPLSGRLFTPEWAAFDTALVTQGPLRLISHSPKLHFSYYTGAVLGNSLLMGLHNFLFLIILYNLHHSSER